MRRKKVINPGQEITQIIELIDTDIKQLLPSCPICSRNIEERLIMITTDVEDVKAIEIELLEIKKIHRMQLMLVQTLQTSELANKQKSFKMKPKEKRDWEK